MSNNYVNDLAKFAENDWLAAVESIVPNVHEVDRNAVRIWFRFYPLSLFRFLEAAEDREKTIHKLAIQGEFELVKQIDTSHSFLYGHRYWAEAKAVIVERATAGKAINELRAEIEAVAQLTADKTKANRSLTFAIAAVGLMTLVQSGLEAFAAAPGKVVVPSGRLSKSPEAIVAERGKDDAQGLFGFLRSVDKKYTVTWDETRADGTYRLTKDEDLATASGNDQSQDWKARDERCWEGVVPVECRSAACGTCWVGVLGGQDKLADVQRLERKQMEVFGYGMTPEAKPYMRLACQAKADGNVTFVIPPWNGVFGRKVYGVEEVELKPATTSAKKLRESIESATTASGE